MGAIPRPAANICQFPQGGPEYRTKFNFSTWICQWNRLAISTCEVYCLTAETRTPANPSRFDNEPGPETVVAINKLKKEENTALCGR